MQPCIIYAICSLVIKKTINLVRCGSRDYKLIVNYISAARAMHFTGESSVSKELFTILESTQKSGDILDRLSGTFFTHAGAREIRRKVIRRIAQSIRNEKLRRYSRLRESLWGK